MKINKKTTPTDVENHCRDVAYGEPPCRLVQCITLAVHNDEVIKEYLVAGLTSLSSLISKMLHCEQPVFSGSQQKKYINHLST